ncbi:MAG: type II toxin-antitoxin system RelE/ParE family toxin [Bacteroidetes bacterium]|nr:type II toxin-antitoxin system RelE/ParE family toxin [Bacteroidota bacterium]
MIVRIDKAFEKDTDKIRDKKILNLIADCIENIQKAIKIEEINHLKKLQGYNSHYRIKIKDYRIGLIIENNVIELVRFLHRKEIYRYFPN